MLLRRGRRHCARRERAGGRRDGSREARWRAAGRVGGGPSAGTCTSGGAGLRGRAGKGGAKGNGKDGAGTRNPSPRRRRRLIGLWCGRRGRGRLSGRRADWPRTLRCRHWRRAAGRPAWRGRCGPAWGFCIPAEAGVCCCDGRRSVLAGLAAARGVRSGWGGGASSRAREISAPQAGRPLSSAFASLSSVS